jgi:hypothetical protein
MLALPKCLGELGAEEASIAIGVRDELRLKGGVVRADVCTLAL